MMTKKENHLELGRPSAVMCKTKYINDTSEKSITYHSQNQINQALEFLNQAETLQEGNSGGACVHIACCELLHP